jgi:hypothetical protein
MMGQSMMPIIAKEIIIITLNFWESDYNNRYPSMQDLPSPLIYISRKLSQQHSSKKNSSKCDGDEVDMEALEIDLILGSLTSQVWKINLCTESTNHPHNLSELLNSNKLIVQL